MKKIALAILLSLGCVHCAGSLDEDADPETNEVEVDVDTDSTETASKNTKEKGKQDEYLKLELKDVLVTSY